MSVYNETPKMLSQSINSILNQTYTNFEFIIVLDNPKNSELLGVLSDFSKKDSRIKLLVNDVNLGLPLSLNKAIAISNGEYIARMDADDISLPNRFEIQHKYFLDHPECDLISTNRIYIDENDNLYGDEMTLNYSSEKIKQLLKYRCIIVHPTIMIKKNVLTSVGGYRDFKAAQDYDLWLRLSKIDIEMKILPDVLLYYRMRKDGISQSNYAKQYAYSMLAQYLYKIENSNCDLFNEENKVAFFKRKKLFKDKDQHRFNKAYQTFDCGLKDIHSGKTIIGLAKLTKSLFIHKALCGILVKSVKFKICAQI